MFPKLNFDMTKFAKLEKQSLKSRFHHVNITGKIWFFFKFILINLYLFEIRDLDKLN